MAFAGKLVGAMRLPAIARSFSRVGYRARERRFTATDLDVSLAGKTCVVSGANQGIGLAIARALAARDADVIALCRDERKGAVAVAELAELGTGQPRLECVDISSLASIRELLQRLECDRVHALVHNAGALFAERRDTAEGIEQTFALHVVGPEAITRGLLAPLRAGAGRVIYVASGGMYSERLDVDALIDPPSPFDGVRAYARAKRAQVALAEMWAAREPGVSFYAMHPGWVDTAGVSTALPRFYRITRRWLRDTEQGADTAVWLAAAEHPAVTSGAFVFDREEAPRYLMPGTRETDEDRQQLWQTVERLVAER